MYLFIWKAEWATEREAAGEMAIAGAWHLQVMIIRDDHIRLPFSSASTAFGPFEEYFWRKKYEKFHSISRLLEVDYVCVETQSDEIPNKLKYFF